MNNQFETKRLIIRKISRSDADFMYELMNTKEWIQFIGDRSINSINDALDYIEGIITNPEYNYHVFELKSSKTKLGLVTFLKRENYDCPDLGFAILPQFSKNGYVYEAASKYLEYILISTNHKKIIAITNPKNTSSINLLKKLNFRADGLHDVENELLSIFSFHHS